MANWKKILLSGSSAHIASITASVIPNVEDNATLLFAGSNGEIQTNSNITFNSTDSSIEFNGGTFSGSFSGSFTGDGSGLTGVGGTADNALTAGAGLQMNTSPHTYDGGTAKTISIDLATDSGLITNAGGGSELAIDDSIAGDGLTITSKILAVGAGSGIDVNANDISVDVSDFIVVGGGLQQGAGETIEIDSSTVISSSATITIATASNNLGVTANGTHVATATGEQIVFADNSDPVFTISLSDTLAGNFTFENDVTIQGDLNVTGDSSTVNFQTTNTNISDPFVLVASGSTGTTDGGIVVQTGTTTGAYMFYDASTNAWGVSNVGESLTSPTLNLAASADGDIARIVTCEVTSSANEYDMYGNDPIFGAGGNAALGSLRITTSPAAKQSSLFIFA